MKVKTTVFIYFGFAVLLFALGIYFINYTSYKQELENIAKEELKDKVELITHSIITVINNSVKNYLYGMTSGHVSLIARLYEEYEKGEITLEELKDRVQYFSSNQIIGETGYIGCVYVGDDKMVLDIHPFLRGDECTGTEACIKWAAQKNGYLEYEWINPDDESYRKKAAYLKYFEPLSWVVGATTYKDELASLIQIEDLRDLIQGVTFKESGYFFLFDEDNTLLIHPEMEGQNITEVANDEGIILVDLFRETSKGFASYSWRNPSEKRSREKIAYSTQIDFSNWYLVGSVYFEEINKPVRRLEKLTVILVLISSFLIAAMGLLFSRNLENQLSFVNLGIERFYENGTPFKMKTGFIEEVGNLGAAFEKASEEIILSREERERLLNLLESIINSMPSALIAVDGENRVILWNTKAEERTDVTKDDAVGRRLDQALPEFRDIEASLKRGKDEKILLTRKIGSVVYRDEVQLFPIQKEGITGTVIRIDDITEEIKLKEALQQSQKMDALGHLTGGIAHDFNNMIAGILNTIQLLEKKTDGSERARDYIKMIKESSIRAGELTAKLLQFSRKSEVDKSPEHFHDIVHKVVNILDATVDKRVALTTDLSAERDTVQGNYTQLQNVLINLGINASHAIKGNGHIVYRTKLEDLDENYCRNSLFKIAPGPYIRLEVEDDGSGIPEDIIDQIFDPFFTTKEQGKGTGLGLSTVYGIIQQHLGSITVESVVGRGTVFILHLPLVDEEDSSAVVPEEEVWSYGSGTILLIDDEEVLRTSTEHILTGLGYTVLTAVDGREGVELFRAHMDEIDVVFSDMIMPNMNGKETFKALKELDENVKVVFCSGFTEELDIEEVKAMGALGFLTKPYNTESLSRLLKDILF